MNKYECTECGQELESPVPPKRPCKCGARGKWKKIPESKTLRKNRIVFRVSDSELKTIEGLAKQYASKNISQWVRYAALRASIVLVLILGGAGCATGRYEWKLSPDKTAEEAQADLANCQYRAKLMPQGHFGDGQYRYTLLCMNANGHNLVYKSE